MADHPFILGHFVFTLGAVSGTSSSYRPVSVSCWSTDERLHFASLLEVFNAVCSSSEEWMFWYRECMGSVEIFRRTNLAESRTIKKLMTLSQALYFTKPSSVSLTWDSHASDLKWLGLVSDRTVLSQASFSREASSILRLKKPLPFASLSKVWDSTTQKNCHRARGAKGCPA